MSKKKILMLCIGAAIIILTMRYIQNRENETKSILVAFIDSACSRESNEQFSNVLWHNEEEIADNGIDDDNNGYIDDIYGWNFQTNEWNVFTEISYNHCDYVLRAFADTLAENNTKINYEIMMLNILGDDGECSVERLIEAITYAEIHGAQICNLSLSTYYPKNELKEIIEHSKMLFVVAAGNEGENLDEGFPGYPTNFHLKNVISVAALDENGTLLKSSNYGENAIDVYMNGIVVCENKKVEGTSIAAGRTTAVMTALGNTLL